MHQRIIDNIFNKYKSDGYVTEDNVFDALIESNVSLDKVDYICDVLLSMGVIIKNDSIEDEDDFSYDYSQTDYDEIFRQVVEIDESLKFFIDEVKTIKPPQNREWQNLILQAQNGNKFAKERIFLMYLRIVIKTALYHYQRYNISLSEAIQNGGIGLMIAIEKFQDGKNDNFSQYAPWWIRQQMIRKAEFSETLLRYPVHYKNKMFLIYDIIAQHSCFQCLDEVICPQLIKEVSKKLECNHIDASNLINSLIPALNLEELIEFNENIFNDNGLFEEELNEMIDSKKLKENIEEILSLLKDREKDVIKLRFGLGTYLDPKTLEEIGIIFGVTRERIRQIESNALRRLRHPSKAKYIKPFW